MRGILVAICTFGAIVGSGLGFGAQAQSNPVVVELYTSQGCSSCPPADALLGELTTRENVIPLALHVDYWDYIGWADPHANPAFTKRQKGYAYAAGQRTIYTPQMIVGGKDHVVGYKPMQLADLIEQHRHTAAQFELTVARNGAVVEISAQAVAQAVAQGEKGIIVQLVRYKPQQETAIRRGENAGKTLMYHNIVTDWQELGTWDATQALSMQATVTGDEPVVILLQKPMHGPILAAARLR